MNIEEKLKAYGYNKMPIIEIYYRQFNLFEVDKTYTLTAYILVNDNKIINYSLCPIIGYITSQEQIDFIQETFNELMKDIDEVM